MANDQSKIYYQTKMSKRMNRERIFAFFCVMLIIGTFPGCGGKKTQKASQKPIDPQLQTSLDMPLAFEEEKLDKLGVSSEPGQLVAQNILTQEESGPQPITPESLEKKESKPDEKQTPKVSDADEPAIEFNFENADLETLINQVADLFDLTFVADDSITPMLANTRSVRGNKISFKTQRTLSKREAWNLFLTFLEIAGFAVISDANPKIKRIVTIELARKSPLPAYIGVPSSTLPDNDSMVRFVYFVENTSLETIRPIVEALRSPSSSVAFLQEVKGFVLTDKAYNIKSLMNIVNELDKLTMPQAMSVLKLRRADATEVKKLYDSLAQIDEKSLAQQRFNPSRKTPSSHYFSDQVNIFAEPRTNSLILLGPADAIKRIEDFITSSVDVELSQPYSPLHVLPLRYADATNIANIMNEVTKFGASTEAGKAGGVRNGDKYMKQITFTPEPETNRLIIRGDYEDFLKAKDVVLELDAPQPQVAIEVLLLGVTLSQNKQLGVQMRSRVPGSEGLLGQECFMADFRIIWH